MKKAFSLVELMISIIIISCICSAFAPVISKRLSASHISKVQNTIPLPEDVSLQDKITMLEAMRDCRLNKDKTRLICEVELSELKSADNKDKTKFNNNEERNDRALTIKKNSTDNVQKNTENAQSISIPVKESEIDIDETIDADTINSINELLKNIQTQEISNYK